MWTLATLFLMSQYQLLKEVCFHQKPPFEVTEATAFSDPTPTVLNVKLYVRLGTKDVHFLCTDLVGCNVEEIVGMGWRGIK